MDVVKSKAAALTDLAAVTTLATGGKVALYQDDGFVPDSDSTAADLTTHEANYTGYTPGGVAIATPLGPYTDTPSRVAENFATILFQPSGPVLVSNDIRGACFLDTGGAVRQWWIFDAPIPMATVLDKVLIDPKYISDFSVITV